MKRYYVNELAQPNGDHEVHAETCMFLSLVHYKRDLGLHNDCESAVIAARRIYSTADGCYWCSRACHTS